MKKLAVLFVFLVIMMMTWSRQGYADRRENVSSSADSLFDLYLLIGQSNMAGRGEIADEYKNEGNSNVLMLDKENHWVQARHPLHFDKPSVVGVGPGLSFGIKMAKKNHGHKIGLIPCAVGGTSINTWKPGGFDEATKTHPYDDMIVRLQEAQKNGIIKGVIWLHGESDSNPEKAKDYLAKLEELINRIRTVTNNPSLPFVAGELGQYKEQYRHINKELAKLPAIVKYTEVASSKGFIDKGDSTHFNSASAEKYGVRFAKAMKRLQKDEEISGLKLRNMKLLQWLIIGLLTIASLNVRAQISRFVRVEVQQLFYLKFIYELPQSKNGMRNLGSSKSIFIERKSIFIILNHSSWS